MHSSSSSRLLISPVGDDAALNNATAAFLKSTYREFYFRRTGSIEFPDDLQSREFGYIPFGGGMVRHLSFKNAGEATAEILKQTPSSVYCSNARYQFPSLPMEEKEWMGAELIFDIDATDISTPCKKGHDLWFCDSCLSSGRLPKPPKCPKCGGVLEEFHGTCEVCISASKDHAVRLFDFLVEDFGIARADIRVYFSGNRGYHLHVFDSRFDLLNQQARAEIAGYVRGDSLPATQTISSAIRRKPAGEPASSLGWMRRIDSYVDEKKAGHSGTVQKLVSEAISTRRAMVDSSVTTDVHRVFRLAGTLHGNTGMCKMRVHSFEAFDPDSDPVVLSSEAVRVRIRYSPQFSIKGTRFGPFKEAVETLPTYAAVSILTRGFGEVA